MDERVARAWVPIGLLAVVVLAVGTIGLAAAFDSGGTPGGTGPDVITWTGQGASSGALGTVRCDASQTPGGEADQPYLRWVLATDGGSAAAAVLHLSGSGSGDHPGTSNPGGSRWHFDTPYVTPDAALHADATFAVTATGNGAWELTISHGCPGAADAPITVAKVAAGSTTTAYAWAVTTAVEPTRAYAPGGATVPVTDTIVVTHDTATTSAAASGTITLVNALAGDLTGVGITDTVDNGGTCAVAGGGEDRTVAPGTTTLDDTCTDAAPPTLTGVVNTVRITWPEQTVAGVAVAAGETELRTAPFDFATVRVDRCVAVTDAVGGADPVRIGPGRVCVDDPNPTTITVPRSVVAVSDRCVTVDDTATVTADDTGAVDGDSASVTVCGNVTGGFTIGYWQHENGQTEITGASTTAGVCDLTGVLRAYAPFQDLAAGASCTKVAAYVTTVVKAADAAGASMNAMLKARMLATVLDVWKTPRLGTTPIDLTLVCKVVTDCGDPDTDPGRFRDTSAAFGNPPVGSCPTVQTLLDVSASRSNVGGVIWFGNVEATQELAKDTFDAVDNGKAWAC